MPRQTLLDIAKHNGSDAVVGLIDETTKAHPELSLGESRTIKGLSYKTLVRTGIFDGSTFRNANDGSTVGSSKYENRQVDTFILDPRWECDKAVADKHEDGAQAFIALEGESMVEKAMVDLSTQFYYGNKTINVFGSTAAFPGLIDSYDRTNLELDAGGTTANTGSSVWFVKFGPKHVQWVWGANGQLELSDARVGDIVGANGKPLTGYITNLLAYPGLQVASVRSVGRIKKVTEDSGKGLTDALISRMLAKFEVGIVPDLILCSRRSRMQLQMSRSVTIMTGAGGKPTGSVENVAPTPTEAFGIPLQVTDAIRDTEPLTI